MGTINVDRSESGVAIITLDGEHDTYSVPRLELELERAIRDQCAVVVDLTATEFIDSSVIAILLRAREEAHVNGCKFALVMDDATGSSVQRLFEMTGLGQIFPIGTTRDKALAAAR